MDLIERFAPLMAEALHCAGCTEGELSLEEINAQITSLAEKERHQPIPVNNALPDIKSDLSSEMEDARFAVYAFVDEKILNSERMDASDWMSKSLQCHYFKTTAAGKLFFERLNNLLTKLGVPLEEEGILLDLPGRLDLAKVIGQEKSPLLRLFALCLLYGFKGYLFINADLLARIRKSCWQLLKEEESPESPTVSQKVLDKTRSVKDIFENISYVVVPATVAIIFWFFCANILSSIPIK
ncbi:MAG: DotU family type IV/VI secretion system protein [Desulfovibrionaceae bacterium]|nr:DotU family type IV/VI secretion system protein [Desulfovibrionaceae bacterium]